MSREKTLEDMFRDITPIKAGTEGGEEYTTLSLWIPCKDKARYKALHRLTRQEIHDRIRKAFLVALDVVESKAS